MKSARHASSSRRLLAACLLLGAAAAAHAAGGYVVARNQEPLIAPGMTAAQVQQVLGQPAFKTNFRNEPGPTFIYYVAGPSRTAFDVAFDAHGVVISTREGEQPLSRYGD
jgi:outer membrane protein assembly factor BamE (lipoprotein component of BamABCDE complex)